MFGLFGSKAATIDDGPDGSEAMAAGKVKIGGHEFLAGDAQSSKAFDAWVAKAKATGEMIPVGKDGAHYPLTSPQGEAELIKAELQIKHNIDPVAAQKAVDQLPGMKAAAQKPFIIYKGAKTPGTESAGMEGKTEAKANGSEAVAKKGQAKAGEQVYNRGPRQVVA